MRPEHILNFLKKDVVAMDAVCNMGGHMNLRQIGGKNPIMEA